MSNDCICKSITNSYQESAVQSFKAGGSRQLKRNEKTQLVPMSLYIISATCMCKQLSKHSRPSGISRSARVSPRSKNSFFALFFHPARPLGPDWARLSTSASCACLKHRKSKTFENLRDRYPDRYQMREMDNMAYNARRVGVTPGAFVELPSDPRRCFCKFVKSLALSD